MGSKNKTQAQTNLLSEFYKMGQDYLKLLGEKARKAERNKTAEEELVTLEFFYDASEAIIKKYDDLMQALRHENINTKVMQKLFEVEYEKLLKDVYTPLPDPPKRMNQIQFEKTLKKVKSKEVTIWQVCQHFLLTDEQIKKLSDAT